MLPSALGVGEGGSFRSPMATAVIGGLIASTFLSLIFVPSFYIAMDDLARLSNWLFGRFIGKSDEIVIVDPQIANLQKESAETASDVDELATKLNEVRNQIQDLAQQIPKPKPKMAAE
jgi:peptidoglycan hydrolase CwlO-like protein